jgi:hypothetical protein
MVLRALPYLFARITQKNIMSSAKSRETSNKKRQANAFTPCLPFDYKKGILNNLDSE